MKLFQNSPCQLNQSFAGEPERLLKRDRLGGYVKTFPIRRRYVYP